MNTGDPPQPRKKKKRRAGPLTQHVQYVAARLAVMGLSCFEVKTTLAAAAALGRQVYRLDGKHRQRAIDAIRQAYPLWSSAQVRQVACQCLEHLMQLAVEVVYSPRLIHRDSWAQRVELDPTLSRSIRQLNTGRPAIFLTGHFGNWEVMGQVMALLGYPLVAVARPLDNRPVNDWVLRTREARGMRVITKWEATDELLRCIDAGRSLGFIADQNAGEKGLFVPYFGRLASTYKSIALLAVTRNLPVVCGYAYRVGEDLRYRAGVTDVIEPGDWASHPDPVYYVTARYMRGIEAMVRLEPTQYVWMHRRWKTRPRHEREGQPMPASLRRRLEGLPWMTPAQLESLAVC